MIGILLCISVVGWVLYDQLFFSKRIDASNAKFADTIQNLNVVFLKRKIETGTVIAELGRLTDVELQDQLWTAIKNYNSKDEDKFIIDAMSAAHALYKRSVWKENPQSITPGPVSKEFIEGLKAAGADESLIKKLDNQHKD